MAQEQGAGRMRALMSMFEEKKEQPPPQPKKERFHSALDAPRPELSTEARSARVQSLTKAEAEATREDKGRRYVPQIGPTDTDEERELKRKIQAKEQEILDLASRLKDMADRLDVVVSVFHNSLISAAAEEPVAPSSGEAVKAFQKGPDLSEKEKKEEKEKSRMSAPSSSGGTSLEAILAAARSGKPRVKSETPKYSKLLRDLK
eukprot:GFKZ01014829.1.p1 GENE.GFKZ01014829.1~~GFKZ01014829.1.p1  ORF type:complete len:204 (-),score=53.35 GFKZ01014829.1:670-1281(-)